MTLLKEKNHALHLTETNQSVWDLASIQLAGWTSLPILVTSLFILEENSILGAMLTILVGNAILWFIRLGILAMSHEKRKSALDISKDYLGSVGGYFISILLLVSTLVWYLAQTTAASKTLTSLISFQESDQIDQLTQISVFLGIVSAFLCMNGISILRKLCAYTFPLLILAFFIILFSLPNLSFKENGNPLSLAGLSLVLATNLGITSDMPTFFRHSKSWATSVKALTVIQLVSLALGLGSLYFSAIINEHFQVHSALLASEGSLFSYALIFLVFASVICANVANVYSASVGWEILAPKALIGRKEYLILGLGLTTLFILLFDLFPLESVLGASDGSLVNLCIVLVLGHLLHQGKENSLGFYEKTTYFIAWLLSTLMNIYLIINPDHIRVSLFAINLSVIIGIVFILLGAKKIKKLINNNTIN